MVFQYLKKPKNLFIAFGIGIPMLFILLTFVIYPIIYYGVYVDYIYNNAESTDLSEETLAGLALDTSFAEVQNTYDNILKRVDNERAEQHKNYYYGEYLTVQVNELEEIVYILVRTFIEEHAGYNFEKYSSSKVKPGDSKEDIILNYGKNYYEMDEKQGFRVIGYVDWVNEVDLKFGLNEYGEVMRIELSRQ